MCGIAGSLDLGRSTPPDADILQRMLGLLEHRGPDEFGLYRDDRIALGSARLAIVDLAGGTQPIHNEDESVWIVFNGEIFNHPELRDDLRRRGHSFETASDTEVLVHLYEEVGDRCCERLSGQFAFAIWDTRSERLLLGRDRLGVRPLYYTVSGGALIFASEIKAIFADERVSHDLDPRILDQVFTCWAPLPTHTAFRDVRELPAGHVLVVQDGELHTRRYWALSFPTLEQGTSAWSEVDWIERFRELLFDATRRRLQADVPVGTYLSGGLDSAVITAISQRLCRNRLQTFSITFDDPAFDESSYQSQVARFLGVDHQSIRCTSQDIAAIFPEVIWHTEIPVLRTSPAPMYLLSRLVRQAGYKVVLTGEGADELLAGYDIFKEDAIRRFWARDPASRLRPLLFRRIYPDVPTLPREQQAYLEAFFGNGLRETSHRGYSHLLRWRTTARLKRLFSQDVCQALTEYDLEAELEALLDGCSLDWHPLSRAQYLEITTFLTPYLLSSQGDRVAMAHSVEGRFPFLDERVVEFCSRLPPEWKLRGLREKYILKQIARDLVPGVIRDRVKKPYRAPIQQAFFGAAAPDYVGERLSPAAIARAGYFNPAAVSKLVGKARSGAVRGEMDAMAIVGLLSVQLLHYQFVEAFPGRWSGPGPRMTRWVDRTRSHRSSDVVCRS